MSAGAKPAPDDPSAADLLADWLAIWQSEAAALALDPEWRDAAERTAAPWTALLAASLAGAAGDGGQARPAGSGPPPGTAAAGAALGAGGDRERRIAELERELTELRRR